MGRAFFLRGGGKQSSREGGHGKAGRAFFLRGQDKHLKDDDEEEEEEEAVNKGGRGKMSTLDSSMRVSLEGDLAKSRGETLEIWLESILPVSLMLECCGWVAKTTLSCRFLLTNGKGHGVCACMVGASADGASFGRVVTISDLDGIK